MNIKNYLPNKKQLSLSEQIIKLSEGKSKEEKRLIEYNLGKPEEMIYSNKKTPIVKEKKVGIISIPYRSNEEYNLIKKYFTVRDYNGENISDIKLLISFLNLLEQGKLKYEKETNKLRIVRRRSIITTHRQKID